MINVIKVMNISTAKKSFTFLILLAFLIVGLLGLSHFAMNMNDGGEALGCPFMNTPTLCAMNPFYHIAVWQSMFAASFLKETFSLLALIALLGILFTFILRNFWLTGDIPRSITPVRQILIRTFTVINPLQEAFSNGILHSKIF